ncbi:MAG: hypothetical protein RLZZ555_348 [Pseudomonadota bacterium]|jgi:competence protein ComEC
MSAVLLGAVLGVALQLQQPALWSPLAYQALLLSGIVGGFLAWWRGRESGQSWRCWLAALAAAMLMAGVTGLRANERLRLVLPPALEGQELLLQGYVSGLPRVGARGVQFEFEVESARWNGLLVDPPGRIQLGWWRSEDDGQVLNPPDLLPGQRWELLARLQRPYGLANPQGLDLELWFWEQGLLASGSVRTGKKQPPPRRLPGQASEPVAQARAAVRAAIGQAVAQPRAAGVLAALVVGDQAAIDATDWEVFRLTGIAHLVSISGLHVTMFAWLAAALLARCWRLLAWAWPGLLLRWPAQPVAAVGGVLLAFAYAVFAGWGVPAQRTVLMLALLTTLRLAGLRWPWPVLLLAAMVAVLLLDPWALLQPGFWLSFVAVGVLLASSWLGQEEASGLRAWWLGLLRTQLIVSVALAPLTLLSFGQLSIVGLLANLLAVPWVSVVVTPLAMLGVIWSTLWRLGAWCVELMTGGLELLARLSWAAIERPELPASLALLTLLGAVLLVLRQPWVTRCWGLLLVWPLMAWAPARPAPGEFELLAPDVGQGGAIVVRTARHTLVHDTGPGQGASSAAQRVLLPLLRVGGDRLDLLVASHDDLDHAGGLSELLRQHPRAELWASYDTRRAAGRAARFCAAGQRWSWDGVAFEWLNPRADAVAGLSDNELSCVLLVQGAKGRVALLTGDIGLHQEARLLEEKPELRADLLIAGHHGSASSTGAAWLDALRPSWVLIQSGHLNRFGHPAPELLKRLSERDIRWHASPQCGAASWQSANPDHVECWRQRHRHYWQTQAVAGRS